VKAYPVDPDYAVTTEGRVFRVNGGRARPGAPVEIKTYLGSTGYLMANCHDTPHKLHRILAITFIANPDNKPVVAHRDGDKLNNKLDNLYWATVQENNDDTLRHGNRACNERHGNAVLTAAEVAEIRALTTGRLPRSKPTLAEIGAIFGVSKETIADITKRRSWFR
jgi:hypothetical protein